MDSKEKEVIYSFLSTAERWARGYGEVGPMPVFSDDPEPASAPPESPAAGAGGHTSFGTIDELVSCVRECRRCPLAETRTNTVPGIGSIRPLVMVIGEGPGADEDAQGEPFVGKAGQLLDKMLSAIRLSRRTNCYIANIIKCRPPNNRDPSPEESAACAPFIQEQIRLLSPKLILTVGRIAVQNLLSTSQGITRIHGQFFTYKGALEKGIPLMPTYHPSALLRNEELKRPAWEDLKLFKNRLLELAPDYDRGG
ncbi:MAG: uracil-DNA glycosylase [Spirochaetaceae bacterium]|nr:uracil-DNA glycosylase [Spirochaetaceae bacterium]